METSIIAAQLLGVSYLAIGLGMLVNKKHYHKLITKWYKDIHFTYLGGILALIAGVLLTSYHNIWTKDWTLLITVMGWAALLKGFALIIMPEQLGKLGKAMFKKQSSVGLAAVLIILLGLILCYNSYDTNVLAEFLKK